VRGWAGPVVHLYGPEALESSPAFEQLGIDFPDWVHRADRFRLLLEKLKTYRFALLVWTNVGSNEVLLVQTLAPVPSNVGLVLVSPYALGETWPGRPVNGACTGQIEQPPECGVPAFLYLANRDRFAEALQLPCQNSDDVEYWSTRYVASVKLDKKEDAKLCIKQIARVDPIEADLLQANLLSREQRHLEARELYLRTADRAREARSWREVARIDQELAFLADQMGDRGQAEQRYEGAIKRLEKVEKRDRDSRWTSALGRVLRDYADLLASAGREDAFALLERATAIHALEGRITQVAYCRVTRSRLLCQLRRYDEAERCAQ